MKQEEELDGPNKKSTTKSSSSYRLPMAWPISPHANGWSTLLLIAHRHHHHHHHHRSTLPSFLKHHVYLSYRPDLHSISIEAGCYRPVSTSSRMDFPSCWSKSNFVFDPGTSVLSSLLGGKRVDVIIKRVNRCHSLILAHTIFMLKLQ